MELPPPYQVVSWSTGATISPDLAFLDRGIRELGHQCLMPASILGLEYLTEPSFLSALSFHGREHQLVFSRFPGREALASLGIRSLQPAYLAGKPSTLAYFHHLRIHPDKRGSSLLAKGYQALRRVSEQVAAPVTITSILEENAPARELLANADGRGPLPGYRVICPYLTALIPLRGPGARWPLKRRSESPSPAGMTVRGLGSADEAALVGLFRRFGEKNDGAPVPDGEGWPGQGVEGFIGVWERKTLVGAMAVRNPMPWRQIRVNRLHPWLLGGRGFWNCARSILGDCPLPAENDTIPYRLFDPWAVEPGRERAVMPVLLKEAVMRARTTGALFGAWGIPEHHAAAAAVGQVFFLPYRSTLYQVRWPETPGYAFDPARPPVFPLSFL